MRKTITRLLVIGTLLTVGTVCAQELPANKSPFEFVRSGSVLTVKDNSGQALAAIDLDRPEIKGKVLAFTYSAKRRTASGNAGSSVQIYPNPASKQISLQLKGSWKYPIEVQIFDKTGNACLHTSLESSEQPLDVGRLKQGIYILKANSGNAAAAEELIIE